MIFDAPTFAFVQEHLPTDLPPCALPHPTPLPSFWTANFTSPLTNAGAGSPLPESADIVMIGSGLTGSCAVAQLVERLIARRERSAGNGKAKEEGHLKIVVLEAREFCSGATGRNGGHLTPAPTFHFQSIAEMSSVENARRSVVLEDRAAAWVIDTCEAEGWRDAVDLVSGGCVRFFRDAASEAAVRVQVDAAKAAGVDISSCAWLTGAEALQEFGAKTYSALRVPGNNIYPLKFVTKLFVRAQERSKEAGCSIELFTGTPVTSVDPSNSNSRSASASRCVVQTARGAIKTKYVLHATNAYASHLIPSLAAGPHCIVPTRGQVISVRPSPSSNPHWTSAFSASEAFEYFFQRPDAGPVILGGGRAFAAPKYEFGVADDSQVNGVVGGKLREYLGEQFPGWFEKEQGDVEAEWTGIMAYRLNGEPLVGQVFVDGKAQPGQYLSAGYTGHGMTRAPACAEFVAGMLLAELFDEEYEVPEWMPTHYLATAEMSLAGEARLGEAAGGVPSKGRWCIVS